MLQATLEAVASGFGRTCVGLREASRCTREKTSGIQVTFKLQSRAQRHSAAIKHVILFLV